MHDLQYRTASGARPVLCRRSATLPLVFLTDVGVGSAGKSGRRLLGKSILVNSSQNNEEISMDWSEMKHQEKILCFVNFKQHLMSYIMHMMFECNTAYKRHTCGICVRADVF